MLSSLTECHDLPLIAPASYQIISGSAAPLGSTDVKNADDASYKKIQPMSDGNNASEWYAQLVKPFFAPPSWVFGPTWAALYFVIAISFGYVLVQCLRRKLPLSLLLPFLLNLVFNAAYSPIQFGLRNNFLASIDIILILATLLWALAAVWRHARWVAIANIPYLLWVIFATDRKSVV